MFDSLTDDLVAAILRCIALEACLEQLPGSLCARALIAHVPGIEAQGAVTLPPLSDRAMGAAVVAIAALPGVQRLDLQGHVLGAQWMRCVLRAQPRLTALCLSDCTLRSTEYGQELFRLTELQLLDLSHNWLPCDVHKHLRQLTALTCLKLVDSVTFDAEGEIRALANGIKALPALASFSIGALVPHDDGGWADFRPALKRMLRALRAAPVLTSLELHFGHVDVHSGDAQMASLWNTLWDLRQLRRLSLAVPMVLADDQKYAWERSLRRSLGSLTGLTELLLCLPGRAGFVAKSLTLLTSLRRLRLPWYSFVNARRTVPSVDRSLTASVLQLPQLTCVDLRDPSRSMRGPEDVRVVWGWGRAALDVDKVAAEDAIVEALSGATQLRSLRMQLHLDVHRSAATVQALLRLHDSCNGAGGGRGPRGVAMHVVSVPVCGINLQERERRDVVAAYGQLMRVADSMDVTVDCALWLPALVHDGVDLQKLTCLQFEVSSTSQDTGGSYDAILQHLSSLQVLRECTFECVDGRHEHEREVFCNQLPALASLTSLVVRVGDDAIAGVLAACAAHGGLVSLTVHSNSVDSEVMALDRLHTLHHLVVGGDDTSTADVCWEELSSLWALRTLQVNTPTEDHLMRLLDIAEYALGGLRVLVATSDDPFDSAIFDYSYPFHTILPLE